MKQCVTARLLNETEGALRYRQIDAHGHDIHGDQDGEIVGDLYLRKAAMHGQIPQTITVTIDY
jgi:hypothetical protein